MKSHCVNNGKAGKGKMYSVRIGRVTLQKEVLSRIVGANTGVLPLNPISSLRNRSPEPGF